MFVLFMLLVLFVLVNMFIAILAEAYDKAKIEIFGDSFAERDERWKDSVTFIEYRRRDIPEMAPRDRARLNRL